MSLLERLYVPDNIYESNNDLEIPTLDIDMQAKYCDIPFLCYGEQKRTYNMQHRGTLHFYTDDIRFHDIYENPHKVLQHNPRNIVEPNYSLYNDMPISFALQFIYKKRWVTRFLQEKGIRTFVDLNVAPKYYKLNLLGVPIGWSSFCTRGYSDRLAHLEFEYEMAKMMADGNRLIFVVYNGGKVVRDFCQKNNCIYINPIIDIKRRCDAIKKINDTIMFDEYKNLDDIVERQIEKYYKNQVENFITKNDNELGSGSDS